MEEGTYIEQGAWQAMYKGQSTWRQWTCTLFISRLARYSYVMFSIARLVPRVGFLKVYKLVIAMYRHRQ